MSAPVAAAVQDASAGRAAWLERRRQGIGGSDAAAVLGQNPWKSPLALWSEKVGLVEPADLSEVEYVEFGKLLEPVVAKKYERVTKRQLIDYGEFHVFASTQHPWMFATVDRGIVPIDGRGEGSLSIKTTGSWHTEDWEDEPPLVAQIQLQHELVVRGIQWGSFAVLIGGQRFAWCDTERNARFCAYLVEMEEAFWDRVLRGDPPPVDNSDSTREALFRMYPLETGEGIALPPAAVEWKRRRAALKLAKKKLEAAIDGYENQIKAAMGAAKFGVMPDGSGFKWAVEKRSGYTVAPCEPRILREVRKAV